MDVGQVLLPAADASLFRLRYVGPLLVGDLYAAHLLRLELDLSVAVVRLPLQSVAVRLGKLILDEQFLVALILPFLVIHVLFCQFADLCVFVHER